MILKNQRVKVIQIVPQLPPSINGVGDYALNLAHQLRKDYEIETEFVVGDPSWQEATESENFAIQQVFSRSANTLFSLFSTNSNKQASHKKLAVLLHYVGYGYAKRGCPVWLVKGLQRWKTHTPNAHLVTMFHEIYASGPPWASSFWLSPLQRNLATRLAQLSDRILTSRQNYAKTLHELSQGKHTTVSTIPVFSNIGEPDKVTPLAERPRRLVVFGHPNARLQVYQQCLTALEQTCQVLEIEEICDIGIPTGLELSQIKGIPVVAMGVINAKEISEILLNSIASFANFPPAEYLARSTVFAAYCAHRLIPILTSATAAPMDGLQAGKHYWVADAHSKQFCLDMGQAIADNAYAWYHTHSLSVQAKIFADLLNCEAIIH